MTYKAIERRRRGFEPYGESVFRRALMRQLGQATADLKAGREVRIREEPIRQAYHLLYRTVMPEFGKHIVDKFKSSHLNMQTKRDDFLEPNWEDIVTRFVNISLGARIVGVTQTGQELVERIITQAMSEELSIPQTVKLLRSKWIDITRYRATMIARTEIITASNAGTFNSALNLGVPLKRQWLATGGKRTRDTHAMAHGQEIDLRGNYVVGGELLRFPGDPKGSADNIINCRCSETYSLIT